MRTGPETFTNNQVTQYRVKIRAARKKQSKPQIQALPPGLTADGYELQFGTNHVGHALLVKLLLPLLQHTARLSSSSSSPHSSTSSSPRIIINSSQGMHYARGLDLKSMKTPRSRFRLGLAPGMRYSESKLANVLYAAELAKRYPEIISVSVHPGVITTGLVSGLSWGQKGLVLATTWWRQVGVEEGTWNQLWCATVQQDRLKNGEYYEPGGVPKKQTKQSKDEKLAEQLWNWTEKELEKWG